MAVTQVFFMAFVTTPKPLTRNYAMIYIFKTFLGKKVDLIGKVLGSKSTKDNVVKLENVEVKLKGSSGYLAMDAKFADQKMLFYLYERGTKDKLKELNLKPNL
jgi:hypothetical protein